MCVPQISDFGLSLFKLDGHQSERMYNTLTHQPPEALMKNAISFSGDVYSFGVLLWQVTRGRGRGCVHSGCYSGR